MLLLASAALHAGEPVAAPGVEVVDRIEYYVVTGSTAHEIHEQMRRLRPVDPMLGLRYDGYTHLDFSWSYNLDQNDMRCRLTDVVVRLEVRVILPYWQPGAGASRRLRAAWPRYLESLIGHERKHRALGIRGANAIQAALLALKPADDCMQLSREVRTAARAETQRFARLNRQYDRDTDRGAKEIVKLPEEGGADARAVPYIPRVR